MTYICAQNISKEFANTKALNNVSVSIAEGEIFGLLGPNGAGKTTFIRILNQIFTADSGSITINSQSLAAADVHRMGYLPEERGLYKKMKVAEQIYYFAALKGMSRHNAQHELNLWTERLQIQNWEHKKVEELSKGMQQKIQFIVSVIHKPKILVLDEPFSGFDPVNAQRLKEEILRLKAEGMTIILSTHNMNSVEELCNSIALIHKSEKILEGNLAHIKQSFAKNQYRIRFSGYVDTLMLSLNTSYKIIEQHKEDEQSEFVLELLDNSSANDVIRHCTQFGAIVSFSQVIPDMHSIFIDLVSREQTNK
ncbi:MAG: ATP-binding cassette domain-containing protein [Bacteroidales bacterium]|jgi:ABC-2 type transport system ATP-binding protein|nr:ATP-binding cassette domain-containing protein [Bacteroidales bacterium]